MGVFVVLWLICGLIAAVVAQNKGSSPLMGFIIGAVLGIIGILLVALARSNAPKCAYCGALLQRHPHTPKKAADYLDAVCPSNWQAEPDWTWPPLWAEAWVDVGDPDGLELVIADDVDSLAREVERLLQR